jgi:hypothetical protein
MKVILIFLLWCLLFVLAWPVALLALIVLPIVWLLSIPLRIFATVLSAMIALLKAILMLPARALGHRG